jgi:hypothetical protein
MTKMIRCIEGHVFDIESQKKCPQCGWVPAAKKEKVAQAASGASVIGKTFGTIIAAVDGLLGKVGLGNKPGLAAGIVCASIILLFVGSASALTGVFRGSGTVPVATPPAAVSAPQPELQKTTPPPQQKQQQAPSESRQRNTSAEPPTQEPQQLQQQQPQPSAPQQQNAPNQYQQRPHIHVPGEIRNLLRRVF